MQTYQFLLWQKIKLIRHTITGTFPALLLMHTPKQTASFNFESNPVLCRFVPDHNYAVPYLHKDHVRSFSGTRVLNKTSLLQNDALDYLLVPYYTEEPVNMIFKSICFNCQNECPAYALV